MTTNTTKSERSSVGVVLALKRFIDPLIYGNTIICKFGKRYLPRAFLDFVDDTIRGLQRPMINFLSKSVRPLVGVEIGVYKGLNSRSILRTLPIKKLYLVDPYMSYVDYVDTKGNPMNPGGTLITAKKRLKEFDSKVQWIFELSSEAVNSIPGNFDFVYIDGNHKYEYIKKDIELYYPKIVPGGVIGGHDFWLPSEGVIRAVTEFTQKNKIKLHRGEIDWWVVKCL